MAMPTIPFQVSTENPYQITGRCLNREWFAVPIEVVWRILSDQLYFISHAYEIKIHQFVVMNNHFHLMASTPTGSISSAMQFFMSQTSRCLAKEANRINHIWGARFYRSEITSEFHFLNAYKYNYLNPVRAKICKRAEDYPYSTLSGKIGRTHLIVPVTNDRILFDALEAQLSWINDLPSDEDILAIRKALKKPVFRFAKNGRKPHHLNFSAI
jgi:REP element-mobilizing transposase RayT